MTAADRDDDDNADPMLRGMRSVWLEMRDEDPPARGLAELMAAAREQAVGMKPAAEEETPWWRRAFAVMMRPPMLAAATVLVLIGGAVVLKSRGADEVAAPMANRASDEANKLEKERASEDALVRQQAGSGSNAGELGAARATATQTEPEPEAARPVVAPPPPAPMRTPPQLEKKPPTKPVVSSGENQKQKKDDQEIVGKGAGDKAPTGGMVIANDGIDGRVREEKPAPEKPAVAKTGESTSVRPVNPDPTPDAKAPQADSRSGTKSVQRPPAQVSTEQLVKQAETAASRNDCAAVRVTAERIRKLDANTYKSRVANQPTIARCLK